MTTTKEAQAYARKIIATMDHPPSVHELERILARAHDAGAERADERVYGEGYADALKGSKSDSQNENEPACAAPHCNCEHECQAR